MYATNVLNQYTTINEDDGDETLRIALSHDPDGNLSRFKGENDVRYEYDAENRMKRVRPENPSEGDIKVEFLYDWLGRRVKKSVFKRNSEAWESEPEYVKFFVYDGCNVVEEIATQGGKTTSRYYVRGLDLSGTMDGAGGIGGLLATVDPETSSVYYHLYGPNGSTSQLLSDKGRIAAHYEYDLFGNVQFRYGPFAGQNPFRFSTKYFDVETGLAEFGRRYYDPYLARWTSRDPVGEAGGLNLYGFVGNDPVNFIDPHGLDSMVFPGSPTPFPMVAPKTFAQIEADMQLANSLHHAWMDYVHPPLTAAGDMLYGGGIGNWLYDLTHPTPFLEAENIESPDSISDFNSNHDVETGGGCPVSGAKPGRATKGRTKQWEKAGDFDTANEDFDSLKPSNIRDIPNGGRVGELPDGRSINVRPNSSDGRPTIEIQNGKKRIKIRYGE